MNEECKGALGYWKCPICGMPINHGRCPGGCDVRVEIVNLTEVPQFLQDLDPWEYEITLIDKSDSYYPLEEQYATFMIVREGQKRMAKDEFLALYVRPWPSEIIDSAIDEILVEYTTRKECGYVKKIVEEYKDNLEKLRGIYEDEVLTKLKEKGTFTHRVTKNIAEKIKEAARYYSLNISEMIDAFCIYVAELAAP